MRFSVGLPTDRVTPPDVFITSEAVAEIASALETVGVDACYVTDHPIPGDRWLTHGGHHGLDPLVALSFAAAATTTLLLHTNVYVLAYRNPFLAAKGLASLDALSEGRLIAGVAAGYLEPEFAALGVEFEERNDLTDEAIDAIRLAWSGDSVALEGRHFEAVGNTMLPTPAADRFPPLWGGGNSRRAIRRAVEKCQGWLPFPTPPAVSRAVKTGELSDLSQLEARISYARDHAVAVGRSEPLDICFVPFSLPGYLADPADSRRMLDEIAALEELGVGWVAVALPGSTRSDFLDSVSRFADEVVSRAG